MFYINVDKPGDISLAMHYMANAKIGDFHRPPLLLCEVTRVINHCELRAQCWITY